MQVTYQVLEFIYQIIFSSDYCFDFRDESTSKREDIRAFVEIHIEQGNVLEKEELQIDVVDNSARQRRYTIALKGEANHARTTSIGYRKDYEENKRTIRSKS